MITLYRLTSCVVSYYKAFVFAALVLLVFFYKTSLESTTQRFERYKEQAAANYETIKAKTDAKQQSADILIAEMQKQLTGQSVARKKLKGQVDEMADELSIYRDAVILRNSTTGGAAVSKVEQDTSRSAAPESDCNSQLATVIQACTMTDYDYEALYNLYETQCKFFGCK
jgi:hypothetical protein